MTEQTRLKEKYFLLVFGDANLMLYKAPYDDYPSAEKIKEVLDLITHNGKSNQLVTARVDKRYVLEVVE